MIKRISLLMAAALLVATIVVAGLASPAFARSCPDIPGCKTTDDPTKRNPKFTVSNTGNSPVHECKRNPSGKCK